MNKNMTERRSFWLIVVTFPAEQGELISRIVHQDVILPEVICDRLDIAYDM